MLRSSEGTEDGFLWLYSIFCPVTHTSDLEEQTGNNRVSLVAGRFSSFTFNLGEQGDAPSPLTSPGPIPCKEEASLCSQGGTLLLRHLIERHHFSKIHSCSSSITRQNSWAPQLLPSGMSRLLRSSSGWAAPLAWTSPPQAQQITQQPSLPKPVPGCELLSSLSHLR